MRGDERRARRTQFGDGKLGDGAFMSSRHRPSCQRSRAREMRRADHGLAAKGDSDAPSSSPDGGGVEAEAQAFLSKEAAVAAGGGPEDGAGGDFPSSDSEDDDFDPEGMEMRAKSESEGESNEGEKDESESSEGDEDREDGENGNAENAASASDEDEQDASDKSNVRRLAKRSISSDEGSGGSLVSGSDDSDVSLVDEFNDGKENLGLRRGGSLAELSVSDEEAMVIGGKRHRKAVDYKRLHDEAFGNADDKIISEDEDWGPQRRRRRTSSDDPVKPRPPRVRRSRVPSGDASNGVDAQGEGAAEIPGEKRAWRRLPDSAVEALRLVVAVNTLPSKSHKEELATQLGLSFAQVHGWFKNQRHRALRQGKIRGMGAGLKLKNHRRAQLLVGKSYKKSHLVNVWKKPFAGSSYAKFIVREKMLHFAKKQKVVETLNDFSSPTTLPSDWKEAVETITHGSSVPVIAICGAKNVGKSTFSRFLVNSLLNRYKEVAYLDTDVGQPEFTAPGCLSLHVVDNPVVGPPAMHLRSPERCFFYGDVTPKSNPLMYGEHVADLVNYFREKYSVNSISTIPLVINTHGWVKGIGYDVVVDILNSTSPTHVVQVLANSEKKNLPRNKFWDEMSTAETIYVESAVENLPMHLRSARSAHQLRAARFLAYFQQCFGENSAPFPYREAKLFAQTAMSLVKDTPYEVPFTALKIKHLHSEVPPSESLRCVNATIVGLGVTSIDKDIRDNDDMSRSSVPLCLGLGIVKAVDMRKGMFYISTPVPQDQLQHVDVLLQGRVEIPVPLLMARGFMCPYLKKSSQIVEGVGAGAMKSTMKPSAKKVQ